MTIHSLIESHWQQSKWWLSLFLLPLSVLFRIIVAIRRGLYFFKILPSYQLPIPVVVIGNIHSGGTGKTPITSSLIQSLRQRGIKIGVVSRGYGRNNRTIHILNPNSTAADAGDEPLMLYHQTQVPIAVGSNRFQAASALLSVYPDLQLIICDDGLQHYALHRDLEIVVYPASDVQSFPKMLPHGSLREPLKRINHAHALILSNGKTGLAQQAVHHLNLNSNLALFDGFLRLGTPYRLNNPTEYLQDAVQYSNLHCAAIAAIARPERFFNGLKQLGFSLSQTITLPDHAHIGEHDWPKADLIFITEKDAIKLTGRLPENVWGLPVYAIINPNLTDWLCHKLTLSSTSFSESMKD